MTPPRLSAIIPAYNQSAFVGQAIDSVLAQTRREGVEIIVVNDGSTDDTPNVLEQYSGKIHVISQSNAGLSAARNTGLRSATGEFIGFLDSDDLWHPDTIERALDAFDKSPGANWVLGGWEFVDEHGKSTSVPTPSARFKQGIEKDFLRLLLLGNFFPVHAAVVRRACVQECGGFDETLRAAEDWDLWLHMAEHGWSPVCVDALFARYRRHSAAMTRDISRMETAMLRVIEKHFQYPQVVSDYSDIEPHARISVFLYLLHQLGAEPKQSELHRIANALELLAVRPAPHPDLVRRHLAKASFLPETEPFARNLGKNTPMLLAAYYYNRMFYHRGNHSILKALRALFACLAASPAWLPAHVIRRVLRMKNHSLLIGGENQV